MLLRAATGALFFGGGLLKTSERRNNLVSHIAERRQNEKFVEDYLGSSEFLREDHRQAADGDRGNFLALHSTHDVWA